MLIRLVSSLFSIFSKKKIAWCSVVEEIKDDYTDLNLGMFPDDICTLVLSS